MSRVLAQPFSIFTGAPNRLLLPPTSQGNANPSGQQWQPTTPVQNQFKRQSIWFSGYTYPQVQAQVDGTFEWPIQPKIEVHRYTPGGPIQNVLVNSMPGFHSVCFRLSIQMNPRANETLVIANMLDPSTIPPSLGSSTDVISVLSGPGTLPGNAGFSAIPIIGTVSIWAPAAGDNIPMRGIRPVYIPEGYSLTGIFYSGAAAANALNYFVTSITVPSTVPLSTLL